MNGEKHLQSFPFLRLYKSLTFGKTKKRKEGMADMRKNNRKNSIKKERIVMIASSAFVLAALTLTGVYMKEMSVESEDDGYSVDFAALEENVEEKYQEFAQKDSVLNSQPKQAEQNMENDLDYMPLEVGSGLVEIPGLTEGIYSQEELETDFVAEAEEIVEEAAQEAEEVAAENIVMNVELHFSEAEGLLRPTAGEILMPYSMDGSIYFATLDQYKYNPAVIFSAEKGSLVTACAAGRVVEVYKDTKIGNAVKLDLGDGYQVIYGQLQDIQVNEGSYVAAGDTIGSVAEPSKYYSVEGANLYFEMTKDGEAVNPESMF